MKLFGVDIARELKDAIGSGLPLETLIKRTVGTRTAGNLAGGVNPQASSHSCRAVRDGVQSVRPESLDSDARHIVTIIGGTLPSGIIPEVHDSIRVQGQTHRILRVESDPAAAAYQCQTT